MRVGIACVLALLAVVGFAAASELEVTRTDGCIVAGTESCYTCLASTDADGLKCRFDKKALECWGQGGSISSRGRDWVEYQNECAGVKRGKPRAPATPSLQSGNNNNAGTTAPSSNTAAPGATTPAAAAAAGRPTFEFDLAAATKACNTHFYRDLNGKPVTTAAILRVGCTFVARATGIPATVADVGITGFLARNKFGEAAMNIKSTAKKVSDGVFEVTVSLGQPEMLLTAVGEYKLYLVDNKDSSVLYTLPTPVWIIFNPYAPKSPTYIADEASRKDWIENESGAMWVGSGSEPQWSPWTFDQFDANVWQVVFGLTAKLTPMQARDPVQVVRLMAGYIGNNVLEGRWNEPYDDADTPPWLWSSSSAIYKVVNEKKRKAKYGQCMIFSMVTASALRTLGIASQSNTGYDFVQEKGGDLTVRIKWKPDAKGVMTWDTKANDLNGEKLWNFHAWSLAHIARPDLQSNEVTANIVDGTWHAGPGRLSDFKEGKLDVNYDLKAYNPSINSKVIYMNFNPKTNSYLEWVDPFVPAGKIYTTQVEKPGGCRRSVNADGSYSAVCWEDLVMQYKKVNRQPQSMPSTSFLSFKEKRRVGAGARVAAKGERVRTTNNGVAMVSYLPLSNRLGNDFAATFGVQNAKFVAGAAASKVAKVVGRLSYQTYDGQTFPVTLKEGEGKTALRLEVSTADFLAAHKKVIRASTFVVAHFTAFDAAGNVVMFEERKMALLAPKLNMLCGKKTIALGGKISCNINFHNPLPFPLRATLHLSMSGQTDRTFRPQSIVIPAKKAGAPASSYRGFFKNVQYATTTPGRHMIVASLHTDALNEVKGAAEMTVTGTRPPQRIPIGGGASAPGAPGKPAKSAKAKAPAKAKAKAKAKTAKAKTAAKRK